MRQACALACPQGEQLRASRLLRGHREVPHQCPLEGIGEDLDARPVEIRQQLVLDPPAEASGKAPGERRVVGAATRQRAPMLLARTGLLAREKSGSHLYTLSTERECCDNAPGVPDATGGDNGDR